MYAIKVVPVVDDPVVPTIVPQGEFGEDFSQYPYIMLVVQVVVLPLAVVDGPMSWRKSIESSTFFNVNVLGVADAI